VIDEESIWDNAKVFSIHEQCIIIKQGRSLE